MCEITENGEGEFFEGTLGDDDLLENRDHPGDCCLFLSRFIKSAEIEYRTQDLIEDFLPLEPGSPEVLPCNARSWNW